MAVVPDGGKGSYITIGPYITPGADEYRPDNIAARTYATALSDAAIPPDNHILLNDPHILSRQGIQTAFIKPQQIPWIAHIRPGIERLRYYCLPAIYQ